MTTSETESDQEWPTWIDQYRHRLGLLVLTLLFLLYAWLVYVSGTRSLSAPEQVSMAALGIVVSGVFGVLVGMPLAKRRVKIASQLRRAYGIAQTLKNIQGDVNEATGRMKLRIHLTDAAVLTQFWEEIAENFCTALRAPISETERMVDDWGEMDHNERRRIMEEEGRKNAELQKLRREIASARSLERDLEGVGAVQVNFAESIEKLEQRVAVSRVVWKFFRVDSGLVADFTRSWSPCSYATASA